MNKIIPNVVVSMPNQLFTKPNEFTAAAGGKIYIGNIDTDPVIPANQMQVYVQHSDGSITPINQPIMINTGGYPVYNGQIARFVTIKSHSMAVYDLHNAQLFYFPNVLEYNPDMLQQRLSKDEGYLMVGGLQENFNFIASDVSVLSRLQTEQLNIGSIVTTAAWHYNQKYGGASYIWDPSMSKSNHDGGHVISPTVPFNTDVISFLNGKGETKPSGSGCFVSTEYNHGSFSAVQFGLLINNNTVEASNAAVYKFLMEKMDASGGVLSLPEGTIYFGAANYQMSPRDIYKKRGIVGQGVGVTNLVIDNPEGVAFLSTGKDNFWLEVGGFSATQKKGSRTQNLIDTKAQSENFIGGIPRANIHDIRAINFKEPFRINAWVCSFNRLEASNCLVGFSWIRGTSITAGSIYAVDCKYGHIIGGMLTTDADNISDAVFTAIDAINYSSFNSLACDRATGAAYVICATDGVVINGAGIETPFANGFFFPDYTATFGASHMTPIIINGVTTFTTITNSTVPLVRVNKTGAKARFNGFSKHHRFGTNTKLVFGPDVTYCDMDFKDSDIGFAGLSSSMSGLKIDGKNYGDFWSSAFTLKPHSVNGGVTHVNTIYNDVLGNQVIQLALRGDFVSGQDNLNARVSVYLSSNGVDASTSPIGTIDITYIVSSTGAVNFKASTLSGIIATVTDDNFGLNSKAVNIAFDAPFNTSKYVFTVDIDMYTTARFQPTQGAIRYTKIA